MYVCGWVYVSDVLSLSGGFLGKARRNPNPRTNTHKKHKHAHTPTHVHQHQHQLTSCSLPFGIAGPILPVLGVASVEEALGIIRRKPNPLALYVFAHEKYVHANGHVWVLMD